MNIAELNALTKPTALTERIVVKLEQNAILDCRASLTANVLPFELPDKERKTFRAPGVIEIDCAGHSLCIQHLELTLDAKEFGWVSGVVIKNASVLQVESTSIKGASLWGMELRDCSDVSISQSVFNESKHGGLCLAGTYRALVHSCDFSRNGIDPPQHGYGLALSMAESGRINTGVTVKFCQASGNLRKGFDAHCGRQITIQNCVAENVADGGIYAVCESVAKFVDEVTIRDCTVIQDSQTPSAFGIAIGCTSEQGRPTPRTLNFTVENCTVLSRPRSQSVAAIHIYMPSVGFAPGSVTIRKCNVIQVGIKGRSCGISTAVPAVPPGQAQPLIGVLTCTATTVEMTGDLSTGISLSGADHLVCQNNTVLCDSLIYGMQLVGTFVTDVSNVIKGKCSQSPMRVVTTAARPGKAG